MRTRGGVELETPWPVTTGESLRLAVRAEDILVGLDRPGRISARNVCPGVIDRIEETPEQSLVHVDVAGDRFVAKLTRGAVRDLELRDGDRVYLILKSQALRRV